MLEPPQDVDPQSILDVLRDRWALTVDGLAYAPVGFGAHHWRATDARGRGWFVTADDLDAKPWLGADRPSRRRALDDAYSVAARLRIDDGLDFVLSPVPSPDGAMTCALDKRWVMSITPFVTAESGGWGDMLRPERGQQLAVMLARLHRTKPPAAALRVESLTGEHRRVLDLLTTLDEPWMGGPLSQAAQAWCLVHRADIERLLDRHEELTRTWRADDLVVTHGEPHPGNLLMTEDGMRIIDWDTIALSSPQRDLWLAAGGSAGHLDMTVIEAYETHSGRSIDRGELERARMSWTLGDIASLAGALRAPHVRDATSEAEWRYLQRLNLGTGAPKSIDPQ